MTPDQQAIMKACGAVAGFRRDGVPKVRARKVTVDDGGNRLTFYCPWCERDHHHSAGYGYRAAHCGHAGAAGSESPLIATGYELIAPNKDAAQTVNQAGVA
ncbi:hypothetical protein [Cupriavidus metallidurans]|uniref:hypothetical protein n=1 Tax=Cupriavidus metallidurans TaxID=119219 RepID=UPI001648F1C4|nr:hypothetical protein [Cupriavidus metallidurans]